MAHDSDSKRSIALEKRIIFALDVASVDEAKQLVERLEDHIRFFKVGLQLFLAGWFPMVDWIVKRNLEVMLDLKFFDVPQTVAAAVSQLKDRGISFATVHGNDAILEAAAQAGSGVNILAVTVLTSLDAGDLRDLGFQCAVEDLVVSRARRAVQVGCAGVVCSGLEVPRLRAELGDRFFVVVPGVRPVENRPLDDQKRVVDVRGAFLNGADHVVIGRPIRNAANPELLVSDMRLHIAEALKQR
jgi:orotidine-5'-phosphate decarboxylase